MNGKIGETIRDGGKGGGLDRVLALMRGAIPPQLSTGGVFHDEGHEGQGSYRRRRLEP